jgi:hypothetical protein
MLRYWWLAAVTILSGCEDPTSSTNAAGWHASLIAYYPLNSNPNDTLGNTGPMELENAPFLEGGIYCNGHYFSSGDSILRSRATVMSLDSLNFSALTMSAQFKIKEIVAPPANGRPVFMAGRISRWMGVILRADTTISLWHTNGTMVHTTSKIPMDAWQEVAIVYDSAAGRGSLYLNGAMVASDTFALAHFGARDLSTSNFGNGTTFLGYLRELKIYNSSTVY